MGRSGWFRDGVLKLHDPDGLCWERVRIDVGEDAEKGDSSEVVGRLERSWVVAVGVRVIVTGGSESGRKPAIVTASVGGNDVAT